MFIPNETLKPINIKKYIFLKIFHDFFRETENYFLFYIENSNIIFLLKMEINCSQKNIFYVVNQFRILFFSAVLNLHFIDCLCYKMFILNREKRKTWKQPENFRKKIWKYQHGKHVRDNQSICFNENCYFCYKNANDLFIYLMFNKKCIYEKLFYV